MGGKYLEEWEVYPLAVVDINGSKVLLVDPVGEILPFIDEDYMEDDTVCYDDSRLFMRQRWLVDVLPCGPFENTLTTHRYIVFYKSFYQEYSDNISARDFGTERRNQLNPNTDEGQIDDFMGIF